MRVHCELVVVILVLTLGGQVHTGEIIGGHEAKPHSRPYMVLLERTDGKDGKVRFCDGFLLNEGFVLTAAHCQAKSYTVLLGVHNTNNRIGIQKVDVIKDHPHENYNDADYENDIMLLQLSSSPHFNSHVETIDLACKGDLPKSCFVSGWGRAKKNSKYQSPVLMEVNVTLTPECFKENSYCSKGDNGPTEGDSGSPLVCEDGRAYGVVSGGRADTKVCAYTSIPDYRDWIDWVMNNN